MDTTNSAMSSQKTGSQATPFDQVHAHEVAETERSEKEISLFEREKQSVMRAKQDQERKAEEEARGEARKELMDFKENGVKELVHKGEREAEAEVARLQSAYDRNAPALVEQLAKQALDTFSDKN